MVSLKYMPYLEVSADYLDNLGIVHLKGIPYWPQSNGEVERCSETTLKVITVATLNVKTGKRH